MIPDILAVVCDAVAAALCVGLILIGVAEVVGWF